MDVLYENIARLRREQGLRQADLAQKVGYSANTMIAHIEQGTVDLPYSKIQGFAKALNVTVPQLIGYESDEFTTKMATLSEEGKQFLRQCLDFALFTYGTEPKDSEEK
jgi:transcriptional regulator with XRE-family HTH domain